MKYQDQVIQKEINILVEVQIVIPIVRFSIQNQMEIDLEILKFELFGKPKERGLFPMEEVDGLTQDINILGENKMNARLNEFLLDNNIIYFEEYDSVTKNIDSFGNIKTTI